VFLWRISNHASLVGEGGLRASGRWHTRGKRVVYCAESPAAALLEILVHFEIEIGDLPARYRLLKVNVPDDLLVDRVSPTDLGSDWVEDIQATRAIGDTWLTRAATPLLAVPSAVVPETSNVLLNPAYPDAKRIVIVQSTDYVIDQRLVR
jgi:RES domain-containing protein